MSERKYLWETGAGRAALILLIFAIIFNGLAIRSAYRYYLFTDVENPNTEWLDKCNWFYINLWILLDLLILAPSMAVFHRLTERTRKAILAASLVLAIISFTIAFYNLFLIVFS